MSANAIAAAARLPTDAVVCRYEFLCSTSLGRFDTMFREELHHALQGSLFALFGFGEWLFP